MLTGSGDSQPGFPICLAVVRVGLCVKHFTQYAAHSRDAVKESSLLSSYTKRTKGSGHRAVPRGPLLSQLSTAPQGRLCDPANTPSQPPLHGEAAFLWQSPDHSPQLWGLPGNQGPQLQVPGSCCSSYPGNLGPGPDASALSLSRREKPKRPGEYPSVSGSFQNPCLPRLACSWHVITFSSPSFL